MKPVVFRHVAIVARDGETLAQFYENVFDCFRTGSEKEYSGSWLADLTGGPVNTMRILQLVFPTSETPDNRSPMLEILQIDPETEQISSGFNCRGLAHLAFLVYNIDAILGRVEEHGGRRLGAIHSRSTGNGGILTIVFVLDPEDNIVELQHWERSDA